MFITVKYSTKMKLFCEKIGWNEKRFALATTTFHQTLQQTLFRTIVEILTVYADPQRRTDLRNEASKEGAKKLMEVLEELHIPFI